jgi:polyisoprenyl-phosphate glycosyltransferase
MKLSVVVPCYNEQDVLNHTVNAFEKLFSELITSQLIDSNSQIILVDDGSRDKTWELIQQFSESHKFIAGLKLSRNRGHQVAVMAGMENADGDLIITIDADLQDDVNAIREMVILANKGIDIVYGIRESRENDTFFKKFTAELYYKILSACGVEIIFNHADFRLLSRRALKALLSYPENNLFLRGLIPQLGFSTAIVTYSRAKRAAGVSKYPLSKMISFAWQGITSFTTTPLRMISIFGAIVAVFSFIITIWAVSTYLFTNRNVPGWTSTVVPMYFLGGIQILFLGIIGEYIGKIYFEVKRRPRYFIEEKKNL